jgi:hypothetical protein
MSRTVPRAVVLGCAIVVASACGAQPPGGHALPGASVRTPPPVSTGAPPGSTTAPRVSVSQPRAASYPRCRSAQLSARLGGIGMGAGSSWQYVVLTNSGGSPCALSGDPVRLIGVRLDGTRQALPHSSPDDPPNFSLTGPDRLRPGQSAQVAIVTPYLCAAGVARRTDYYSAVVLDIGLSGELVVQLPSGAPLNAICGADVGAWGWPASG